MAGPIYSAVRPCFQFSGSLAKKVPKIRLNFEEIDISMEESLRDEMIKKSNGKRTIPQIFFNEHHVGGFVELRDLEKKGELLNLLKQ